MKLGQIRKDGAVIAAIFEGELARAIPAHTMVDLIGRAEVEMVPLPELAARLASRHPEAATPWIPLSPPEVWAAGVTFETTAAARDENLDVERRRAGQREGMYASAYSSARPHILFKGTARFCVGPGQNIGIRSDSKFTVPEPEIAVVLGRRGKILGYTLVNDVSARDIERENPLYMSQSKMYTASCALGPVIVTADEIPDPYGLEITCEIVRGDAVLFSGVVSTASQHRRYADMVASLMQSNNVPAGSVLCTGTGFVMGEETALAPGDIVRIRVPEIGELANKAVTV